IFNSTGGIDSSVKQVIDVTSGVTSLNLAPAWYFRSGGFGATSVGGTSYALAFEQSDTKNAGQNDVKFLGYGIGGGTNGVNFLIAPDLSDYWGPGATNQITQEVNINNGAAQQRLEFAPNPGSGSGNDEYSVAWNETIYNSQTQNSQTQIGDQVEFAIFTPN